MATVVPDVTRLASAWAVIPFRGSGHWLDGNLLAGMRDAGALAESVEKTVIEKTLAVYRELLG